MVDGTKKINFSNDSSSWKVFIEWLRNEEDEDIIREYILWEIQHSNRAQYIDRARTRYNKLRAIRELKELEKLSGQTINVSYQ
jgi:hypothetical protein